MRTTVVPAQVTTVEDKIAGNLGFSQLMLIVTPIFGGSALFAVLPPFFNYAIYKAVLIALTAAVCCALAIRFKGKILLSWAVVLLRYNRRPMYYIFNRNSLHGRELDAPVQLRKPAAKAASPQTVRKAAPGIDSDERIAMQGLLTDPALNLRFTATKRGGLRVHLTEIARESIS